MSPVTDVQRLHTSKKKKEDAEHFGTGLFSGRKITFAKRKCGVSAWEETKREGKTQQQANRVG